MSTFAIVSLIILAVLAIALVVLFFLGRKAQKRQEEQQAQIEAMKQTVSMLVIDKKRMKISQSGLPARPREERGRQWGNPYRRRRKRYGWHPPGRKERGRR